MAVKNFTLLFFVLLLAGCGSFNPINPPSVSAQVPPPAACNIDGVCAQHIVTPWGYCDYATYQTGKTVAVTLEIGVLRTPTDGNQAICPLPLAMNGGALTSISGNVFYKSWNKGAFASMGIFLRGCTTSSCNWPAEQEHLAAFAYGVESGASAVIPFANVYPAPIHVDHFLLVFTDDLEAKPTTIKITFSGTFK